MLGKLSTYAVPRKCWTLAIYAALLSPSPISSTRSLVDVEVVLAAALGIGAFAASKYNDGATVFMQNATSDSGSVKFVQADQMSPPQ